MACCTNQRASARKPICIPALLYELSHPRPPNVADDYKASTDSFLCLLSPDLLLAIFCQLFDAHSLFWTAKSLQASREGTRDFKSVLLTCRLFKTVLYGIGQDLRTEVAARCLHCVLTPASIASPRPFETQLLLQHESCAVLNTLAAALSQLLLHCAGEHCLDGRANFNRSLASSPENELNVHGTAVRLNVVDARMFKIVASSASGVVIADTRRTFNYLLVPFRFVDFAKPTSYSPHSDFCILPEIDCHVSDLENYDCGVVSTAGEYIVLLHDVSNESGLDNGYPNYKFSVWNSSGNCLTISKQYDTPSPLIFCMYVSIDGDVLEIHCVIEDESVHSRKVNLTTFKLSLSTCTWLDASSTELHARPPSTMNTHWYYKAHNGTVGPAVVQTVHCQNSVAVVLSATIQELDVDSFGLRVDSGPMFFVRTTLVVGSDHTVSVVNETIVPSGTRHFVDLCSASPNVFLLNHGKTLLKVPDSETRRIDRVTQRDVGLELWQKNVSGQWRLEHCFDSQTASGKTTTALNLLCKEEAKKALTRPSLSTSPCGRFVLLLKNEEIVSIDLFKTISTNELCVASMPLLGATRPRALVWTATQLVIQTPFGILSVGK